MAGQTTHKWPGPGVYRFHLCRIVEEGREPRFEVVAFRSKCRTPEVLKYGDISLVHIPFGGHRKITMAFLDALHFDAPEALLERVMQFYREWGLPLPEIAQEQAS